jgi:hypothetical protein
MNQTDELREVCASQRITLYLSNSLRAKREPWIIFKSRGATIADFSDVESALRWFPRHDNACPITPKTSA